MFFCFAHPDFPQEKLPRGVLAPRRIFKGVRGRLADYGNRLGISHSERRHSFLTNAISGKIRWFTAVQWA